MVMMVEGGHMSPQLKKFLMTLFSADLQALGEGYLDVGAIHRSSGLAIEEAQCSSFWRNIYFWKDARHMREDLGLWRDL